MYASENVIFPSEVLDLSRVGFSQIRMKRMETPDMNVELSEGCLPRIK